MGVIVPLLLLTIAIEVIAVEIRLRKKVQNDERIIERLDIIIKDIRKIKEN